MNSAIFKTTREIALWVIFIIFLVFLHNEEYARGVSLFILGIWYIWLNCLYQKKIKIITPGFLFISLNLVLVYLILPSIVTEEYINELNALKIYGWWVGDYYWLYFSVVCVVFTVITIYLYVIGEKSYNFEIEQKIYRNNIVVGTIICIVLYLALGRDVDVLLPVIILCFVQVVYNKKYSYLPLFLFVLVIDRAGFIITRYRLLAVLLPILFIMVYKYKRNIEFNAIKRYSMLILLVVVIGFYGVISEVVKLNLYWGGDYSYNELISSWDTVAKFFLHQLYRIFFIWVKIGGYIIYHVDLNGYYYGITFIKGGADFFDFRYVSLPELGAIYDNAGYAQPGALVEGYANFGIVGACCYLLIIFFFMERMVMNLSRKNSLENLMCAFVPFSKILLDGGSVISALYIWIFCKILFYNYDENIKKLMCRRES